MPGALPDLAAPPILIAAEAGAATAALSLDGDGVVPIATREGRSAINVTASQLRGAQQVNGGAFSTKSHNILFF